MVRPHVLLAWARYALPPGSLSRSPEPSPKNPMNPMDLDLQRPEFIDDDSWRSIEAYHTRLVRAVEAEDQPQAIGSMKDLIETISKVILTLRGEVIERTADFHEVVGRAQAAIERQPGHGLAQAEPIRSISQGALTMARRLGEIRNELGTGHGRALEPLVESEIYSVGIEAGMLWCRWSLTRLSALAFGLPDPLIHDLYRSTFYRGDLARRLAAARLNELDPTQQRQLGVAVGRRAMRETFLVRDEGVRSCADSEDLAQWPPHYRVGVLNGLFFGEQEQLTLDEWMASIAPRLVAPVPDLAAHIEELRTKISHMNNPLMDIDFNQAMAIYQRLRAGAIRLPEPARTAWLAIADHFDPTPF